VGPIWAEELSLKLGDGLSHLLDGVGLVGQHLGRLIDGLVGLWALLQ
jgi:hypothetical protein